MRKPCNECPFLKSTPLVGAPDWLGDVMKMSQENPFFEHSCHQTDPKADGFKGSKKTHECKGRIKMLLNEFDRTPGKGGVYESVKVLAETYFVHWIGKEKFDEIVANLRRKHEEV
jgi:hypothetical protein